MYNVIQKLRESTTEMPVSALGMKRQGIPFVNNTLKGIGRRDSLPLGLPGIITFS